LAFGPTGDSEGTNVARRPGGVTVAPRSREASPAQRRIVVIVPTRNESGTIAEVAQRVLAQQEHLPHYRIDLLVVDGLSTDGTPELVSEMSASEPRIHSLAMDETGLGLALLAAYAHAADDLAADVIAQLDADLSHEPERLEAMLDALAEGFDLAIGSRFAPGGGMKDWPASRHILCRGANFLIRLLTGCWSIRDWTSGYRAFTVDLYRRLDIASINFRDYTLQPALVYEAVRCGARVCETPIIFTNRRWGKSKLPVLAYPTNLLRHFVGARLRRLTSRTPAPGRAVRVES